jgi:putative oxidoreductase
MPETMAAPSADATGQRKAWNVVLWVLQIGAALMFFAAGGPKLLGDPQMVGVFETIGLGQWFRYATGGIEVLSALLLLIPRLAGVGALLLVGVMVGAVLTHLLVVHSSPAIPLTLLVVVAVIAWGRRDRTLRLLGR